MKPNIEKQGPLLLFLIILLGMGLRAYHLGAFSLWNNESFTRFYSESSLTYLWTTGFRSETNPPFYYTVMHFWIPLFGASENALRSFSVLASLIVIVLIYALGKELESRTVGLIAALLTALAPSEIWYAQEARTYALLQVAMSVTLLAMARYLSSSRPRGGSLVLYVLGATCAAYCHYTALFFVIACNLAILSAVLSDHSFIILPKLVRWLGANMVVALATCPLLIMMWRQAGSTNIKWIPPLTFETFFGILGEVVGGEVPELEFHAFHKFSIPLLSFSVLLLIVTGCLLVRFQKLDRRGVTVLLFVPAFFIVLTTLISLHRPILIYRVLLWVWIPISLLLAHVLVHGAKMRLPMLVLVTLVLVIGLEPQLFPQYSLKENWRELLEANQEQFSKADVIVLGSYTPISSIIYYLPADAVPRLVYLRPEKALFTPVFARSFFFDKYNMSTIETKDLLSEINSGKRVCFLAVDDPDLVVLAVDDPKREPARSFAMLPPPDYRFDDELPGVCGMHVLTWGYH